MEHLPLTINEEKERQILLFRQQSKTRCFIQEEYDRLKLLNERFSVNTGVPDENISSVKLLYVGEFNKPQIIGELPDFNVTELAKAMNLDIQAQKKLKKYNRDN